MGVYHQYVRVLKTTHSFQQLLLILLHTTERHVVIGFIVQFPSYLLFFQPFLGCHDLFQRCHVLIPIQVVMVLLLYNVCQWLITVLCHQMVRLFTLFHTVYLEVLGKHWGILLLLLVVLVIFTYPGIVVIEMLLLLLASSSLALSQLRIQ